MRTRKQLPLTSAMAAALMALPACSGNDWDNDVVAKEDTAVCVDQEGKRVEDQRCAPRRAHGGGGIATGFLWYYLGRNSRVPYYGNSINNGRYAGSFQPAAGANYRSAPMETSMTRSKAVSRGGLGSSGRRYGGGWS